MPHPSPPSLTPFPAALLLPTVLPPKPGPMAAPMEDVSQLDPKPGDATVADAPNPQLVQQSHSQPPHTHDAVNSSPTNDSDQQDRPKPNIVPISFDLPPAETLESALKARMEQFRQEKLARMNRFSENDQPIDSPEKIDNTSSSSKKSTPPRIKVSETVVLGARRASIRRGFPTGFDTEHPEELEKRAARIARFGPPDPPPDDEAARLARAARFGPLALSDAIAFSSSPPLETRRNVVVGETERKSVLHLFGVDRMSTREVVGHFAGYGPSWCEWLNDSSCNVVFEDFYTLKRVLRGMSIKPEDEGDTMSVRPSDDEMGDGDDDGKSMAVAGEGYAKPELEWRVMTPFSRSSSAVPLWGRMATEKDVRPERPNPKSQWSRTMLKKRQSADGLPSPKRPEGKRGRRRGSEGDTKEKSESNDRPSRSGTNLSVKKDRDSSIAKAVAKKVSSMDLDRALSS